MYSPLQRSWDVTNRYHSVVTDSLGSKLGKLGIDRNVIGENVKK